MTIQNGDEASIRKASLKNKGLILAGVLAALILWHAYLAWGAYHGSVMKPEEYPGVGACLFRYSLTDLQGGGVVDENIDQARKFAIWNGYEQANGQVHWKVVHNILVSQFGYTSERAMKSLEGVEKYSDPRFLKCRSTYRDAELAYEIEKSSLEKGYGWEKSPRFIYLWSQLAIGKWGRFKRELSD